MLNEYHVKFLRHLVQHRVVFLVVGGQARRLISKKHVTADLDIWVRLHEDDVPRVEDALIDWGREHPQHTNQNMVSPLGLRGGVQIAFPENGGVWFVTRAGKSKEISTRERVDVLTSLEGLDFDECLRPAGKYNVDGATVYGLCGDDLDYASKVRSRR